jgi:hypothetical protein
LNQSLVTRSAPIDFRAFLLRHFTLLKTLYKSTTERYDTQKLENLQVAVTKLQRGMAFDAVTPGVGSLQADAERDSSARKKRSRAARSAPATAKIARTKFQESFKYEGVTPPSRTAEICIQVSDSICPDPRSPWLILAAQSVRAQSPRKAII